MTPEEWFTLPDRIVDRVRVAIRKKRVDTDLRSDVESLSVKRWLGRLSGNWLLRHVQEVAESPTEARPPQEVVESLAEAGPRRIRTAATLIASPHQVEGLVQRAERALLEKIDGGYTVNLVHWINLTLRKKHVKAGIVSRPATAVPAAPPTRDGMDPRKIHPAEIAAGLRAAFGSKKTPLHEMLAYAYCPPNGRTRRKPQPSAPGTPAKPRKRLRRHGLVPEGVRLPQHAVEDLATIRFRDLVAVYLPQHEPLKLSEPETRAVFAGLLAAANRDPDGTLPHFWDPVATVKGWASSGKGHAAAMAAAYQNHLNYSPERVVAELGALTHNAAWIRLESELKATSKSAGLLPPPPTAKSGTAPFSQAFKPHRKVSHWQEKIQGRVRAEEKRQLKHGLGRIASLNLPPQKVLVFLFAQCFGLRFEFVATQYSELPLATMKLRVASDFARRWSVKLSVASSHLDALKVPLTNPPKLRDYAPKNADLAKVLETWNTEVLREAQGRFENDDTISLFAARHHLLLPLGIRPARSQEGGR